jgi:hypothetical protein
MTEKTEKGAKVAEVEGAEEVEQAVRGQATFQSVKSTRRANPHEGESTADADAYIAAGKERKRAARSEQMEAAGAADKAASEANKSKPATFGARRPAR